MEQKNEPKKEEKYLVLKHSDLRMFIEQYLIDPNHVHKGLNAEGMDINIVLGKIVDGVKRIRKEQGKKENHYIVVNEDEPYSEQVWKLILDEERRKLNGGGRLG